jgi:hypothetical protein
MSGKNLCWYNYYFWHEGKGFISLFILIVCGEYTVRDSNLESCKEVGTIQG